VEKMIEANPNNTDSLRPLTAVVTLEEIKSAEKMGTSPFEKLK
jgi:hypothetical protein